MEPSGARNLSQSLFLLDEKIMQNNRKPNGVPLAAQLDASGVSTWIAFKSNGFNSTSQANGSKAGALLFLILSIRLPIFYGVFAYLKDYDTQAPIQKYKNISRDAILIIIMISFVLLITMSSFGVWMTNANHNWNSTQQEHGVQIYFIIVLVLSIMLPFLYGLFYYRKEICERLNKAGDIKF